MAIRSQAEAVSSCGCQPGPRKNSVIIMDAHPGVTNAPRLSPGPSPPPLTARVSSGRVELDVINRGPGVREAGAVITISISTLAQLVKEQASSRRVEAALR